MDVRVLAIEPQAEPGSFDVVVAIGEVCRHFGVKVDIVPIDDVELQVVKSDPALIKHLDGHIVIDAAIEKLVARRYNGKPVHLPAVVGRIEAPVPVALP